MNKLAKRKKNIRVKLKKVKDIKKEPVFEIGLAILRPFLALFVVMTHCYNYNLVTGKLRMIIIKTDRLFFHVRIFMTMSFYFSYKALSSNDFFRKIKRLERLFIPYFIWPLIIFFTNKYLKNFFRLNQNITLNDLKIQLLTGAGFLPAFWYQWDLIFLTISFSLIIILFRNHYNFISLIISLIAIIYQYNGKNRQYFSKFKYMYFPLGRLAEMAPFAVVGLIIASSGIVNYFKKYKIKTLIVLLFLLYILFNFNLFYGTSGFDYNGLKMFFISIFIFVLFAVFPSEKINNKIILKIIKKITNHTGGVYYLHFQIYRISSSYFKPIRNKTIKGCIINYIICYFICFIGSLIFGKTILRNLFE